MRTLRFMNSTNKETHKFLNDIAFEYDQVFCILEAVHAMPGMAAATSDDWTSASLLVFV